MEEVMTPDSHCPTCLSSQCQTARGSLLGALRQHGGPHVLLVENHAFCLCVYMPMCGIDPHLHSYNEVELQLHYELPCYWLEVI